jgi:thioredoxin-like negative regulator of GroEL
VLATLGEAQAACRGVGAGEGAPAAALVLFDDAAARGNELTERYKASVALPEAARAAAAAAVAVRAAAALRRAGSVAAARAAAGGGAAAARLHLAEALMGVGEGAGALEAGLEALRAAARTDAAVAASARAFLLAALEVLGPSHEATAPCRKALSRLVL